MKSDSCTEVLTQISVCDQAKPNALTFHMHTFKTGQVFTCTPQYFEHSTFLVTYDGIVNLENPSQTWTTKTFSVGSDLRFVKEMQVILK